jgi:UTP-glucose-1-phosphate uridylyltransferase
VLLIDKFVATKLGELKLVDAIDIDIGRVKLSELRILGRRHICSRKEKFRMSSAKVICTQARQNVKQIITLTLAKLVGEIQNHWVKFSPDA